MRVSRHVGAALLIVNLHIYTHNEQSEPLRTWHIQGKHNTWSHYCKIH